MLDKNELRPDPDEGGGHRVVIKKHGKKVAIIFGILVVLSIIAKCSSAG